MTVVLTWPTVLLKGLMTVGLTSSKIGPAVYSDFSSTVGANKAVIARAPKIGHYKYLELLTKLRQKFATLLYNHLKVCLKA